MPQSFWTKTGNSSHSGWFEEGTAKQEQQKTLALAQLVNSVSEPKTVKSVKNIPNKTVNFWEVHLSESSGSENESEMPRKALIIKKVVCDKKVALRDHDYCFAIFKMLKQENK
jgi:hypothetical protein